jgi:hypothetical protein
MANHWNLFALKALIIGLLTTSSCANSLSPTLLFAGFFVGFFSLEKPWREHAGHVLIEETFFR